MRRQVIMESSDSLLSQTTSLPPPICENPNYLPPALPPKRHRTNNKLNSLSTPPSSPKLILTESIETPINDLSSQNLNNNNNLPMDNKLQMASIDNKSPKTPTSPSSNYVQMNVNIPNKTISPAVAATPQSNSSPKLSATCTKPPISAVTQNNVVNNKGNEVRVVYSNINNLNTTNNRSSDENHYIQLYDGSMDDQKMHANVKSECNTSNSKISSIGGDGEQKQNNLQKINNKLINNNNSISESNEVLDDDDEDIVVLRHPQPTLKPTSNSSPKVPFFYISLNFLFYN